MEKYIKDGKVAVLYSPGYGAGWSTWIDNKEDAQKAVFDPILVKHFLGEEKIDDVEEYVEQNYKSDPYTGGLCKVKVKWIPVGNRFFIDEYDGSESVLILSPDDGYVA